MSKTRNLGNLTDVLSAGSTYATATTPPQFDNSQNLATTASVVTNGLRYATNYGITTTQILTVAQAGTICNIQGNGIVVTLPLTSTIPIGTRIEFVSGGNTNVVQRQGTDQIVANFSSAVNTVTLNAGDSLIVVYMGSNQWYTIGGSVQLAFSTSFGSSIAVIGYQKLPSGLIVQWGQSAVTTQSVQTVTLPLAFPNALFSIVATVDLVVLTTAPSVTLGVASTGSKTTFSALAGTASTGSIGFSYIAIGW
jgi:hypothetical protein